MTDQEQRAIREQLDAEERKNKEENQRAVARSNGIHARASELLEAVVNNPDPEAQGRALPPWDSFLAEATRQIDGEQAGDGRSEMGDGGTAGSAANVIPIHDPAHGIVGFVRSAEPEPAPAS